MEQRQPIWKEIEEKTSEYKNSVEAVLNSTQFNLIALTHHSTKIEGSTLSIIETQTLLEKAIPATGKPIQHQNMVLDHHEALEFILEQAKVKTRLDVSLLQRIEGIVMRRTGNVVKSVLGETNEAKGDFRKVNVSAGGHYFVNFSNVENLVKKLIESLQQRITAVSNMEDIHTLAFTAHFDLVSIHPFTDGNGRTSRLLMNFIQAYHGQPLTIVQAEDKSAYIQALDDSRKQNSTKPIIDFMAHQHLKWMVTQIRNYKQSNEKIFPDKDNTNTLNPGYSLFF